MRKFNSNNDNAKTSLKQNLDPFLKQIIKPKRKSKSKSKTGDYLRQFLMDLLGKLVSPEAIDMFKPYGVKLIMNNLKGKKRSKPSDESDDGEAMAEKDEYIHE